MARRCRPRLFITVAALACGCIVGGGTGSGADADTAGADATGGLAAGSGASTGAGASSGTGSGGSTGGDTPTGVDSRSAQHGQEQAAANDTPSFQSMNGELLPEGDGIGNAWPKVNWKAPGKTGTSPLSGTPQSRRHTMRAAWGKTRRSPTPAAWRN